MLARVVKCRCDTFCDKFCCDTSFCEVGDLQEEGEGDEGVEWREMAERSSFTDDEDNLEPIPGFLLRAFLVCCLILFDGQFSDAKFLEWKVPVTMGVICFVEGKNQKWHIVTCQKNNTKQGALPYLPCSKGPPDARSKGTDSTISSAHFLQHTNSNSNQSKQTSSFTKTHQTKTKLQNIY